MKNSIFLKNESLKTVQFKSNEKLNEIISKLTNLLKPLQKDIELNFEKPQWPTLLIVGSPRSGTTLMMQWLASLNKFAYPTNFLTRFAYAPHIGALIQEMIFNKEYDFHDDFYDIKSSVNFDSNLGKSKGALASNEFQHFFRNYLNNFDPEYLEIDKLNEIDTIAIAKGLASIEYVFNKPFITKGFMLQYNLDYFVEKIPSFLPLYIKRNEIQNMQSIYLSRKSYFDRFDIWYGPKPKEYELLIKMDVYHQIAGQVYYTNKAIEESLANLSEEKKIIINYEDFCNSPKSFYYEIIKKYEINNYLIKDPYSGVKSFEVKNEIKLPEKEIKKFKQAYRNFVGT